MINLNPKLLEPILEEASNRFILPRYKALKNNEISAKSNPTDLVTLADIEAEVFFEETLPDLIPGSIVIGEESVSRNDKSLDALSDKTRTIWVVDPVDGTYNFVHGRENFGIMISLVYNGEAVGGWIYDILNQNMTFTMKGEGVYDGNNLIKLREQGEPVAPADMDIFLSPKFFPSSIRDDIKGKSKLFQKSAPIGCAAHEYLQVLRGVRKACVYCRLKPWDHLPGTLMIYEAGGYVRKWDDNPYTPQDVYGGLIATTSEEYWKSIFETLSEGIDLAALYKGRS